MALCLGALITASRLAAPSAPELLTPGERAWLAAHPRIVLGAGEDWAATVVVDARGNLSGFIVDYLALLNRRLGTDIRIEVGPWHEIVKKAEAGEIDGLHADGAARRAAEALPLYRGVAPARLPLSPADDPLVRRRPFAGLHELHGKRVGLSHGSLRIEPRVGQASAITAVPTDSNTDLAHDS